jgi:hypothetical protein
MPLGKQRYQNVIFVNSHVILCLSSAFQMSLFVVLHCECWLNTSIGLYSTLLNVRFVLLAALF